ncbi:MAG: alpha/beta fold hydrolase [Bauldia sp.]|uniref:alpha/beta fold hydrolase n=1 Tax=Bauldia sp. TaxID=2575872 RepID=UPI001DF8BD8B|nr:alpha/beta fold hydrolase [Bauldia sp.]MCB1497423.1 alpha/beta fold hydrolase [Bauldia sp.]
MATSRESTVDIAGKRLSYLSAGDEGPPVLLLHGFGADRLTWLLTQRDVASYAATVAIDLPGHGQSDRAIGEGGIAALTDLVAGFLKLRDAGPVHVVGHSLGGAVAIDLAHRHPDLVASLFLLAPAGVGQGIDTGFLSALTEMETLDEASAVLERLVERKRLISPQMTARALAQISEPGAREALRKVAGHLETAHFDMAEAVAGIGKRGLPVTVVWGANDLVNPLAEEAAGALGARLHVVENTGHLPHIESHPEVNALIRAFLAGGDDAAA